MVTLRKPKDQAVAEQTPEELLDAALRDLVGWIDQLRRLESRIGQAADEIRRAGRYPRPHGAQLVFDAATRYEWWATYHAPDLVGGAPLPSPARKNLSAARTNFDAAQEGFARVKGLLANVDPDGQAYKTYMRQLGVWARDVRRFRAALCDALLALAGEATNAERLEATRLAEAERETVTVQL